VDVGQHPSGGDGDGVEQAAELLVVAYRELDVAQHDAGPAADGDDSGGGGSGAGGAAVFDERLDAVDLDCCSSNGFRLLTVYCRGSRRTNNSAVYACEILKWQITVECPVSLQVWACCSKPSSTSMGGQPSCCWMVQ
jgi:hypothetical protein